MVHLFWRFFMFYTRTSKGAMPSLVAYHRLNYEIMQEYVCYSSSLNFSQCKHIYDWVMQHGTDPDKWPDAPKLD